MPRWPAPALLALGAAATVLPWPWDKTLLAPIALVAWLARADRDALRVALLIVVTQLVGFLPASWLVWPLPLLPAIAVTALVLPGGFGPRGAWDRAALPWIFAIIAISSTALVIWLYGLHPDISDLQAMLARFPQALVLLAAVGFPVINAWMEEVIWRGAYWRALERAGFTGPAVLAIQALSFGFAHWHGFPRGPVGVVLASIYGAMLGLLRLRTGGLVVPIVTHIAADVTIFLLLYTYAA